MFAFSFKTDHQNNKQASYFTDNYNVREAAYKITALDMRNVITWYVVARGADGLSKTSATKTFRICHYTVKPPTLNSVTKSVGATCESGSSVSVTLGWTNPGD